jgi:hypothetical protein
MPVYLIDPPCRRRAGERPNLTLKQILAWADQHYQATGQWPAVESGPVKGCPQEKWKGIHRALREGFRGLPGGSSLARLLEKRRGVRYRQHLPRLTEGQILTWADGHHRRTGRWPNLNSGPVVGARGESWLNVDKNLRDGYRGLPGRSSLARLLEAERGVRNRRSAPRLTVQQIRAWAVSHRRQTGKWPTSDSGPVLDAPEENWHAINLALYFGHRGLGGRSSLSQLVRVTCKQRG